MQEEEEALVARWEDVLKANDLKLRQQWYASTWAYLSKLEEGHWWCRHYNVTLGLSEVLRYHSSQRLVQSIWEALSSQLAGCADCIAAYHCGKAYLRQTFDLTATLDVMACLDVQRLLGWFAKLPQPTQQQQQLAGDADVSATVAVPPEVINGLYECLSYAWLLSDAEVCSVAAHTLLQLSTEYDLDMLAAGSRYPGLYRLAAFDGADVRLAVAAALQSLGPLASWQEALDMHIDTLLHAWLDVIGPNNLHATQLPPVSTTASKTIPATAAEGPGGGAGQRVTPQQQQQHEQHEQTIPGRAPYTPSIDACWYGIKVLLQCMEAATLVSALQHVPRLLPSLLHHLRQPHAVYLRPALTCMMVLSKRLTPSQCQQGGMWPLRNYGLLQALWDAVRATREPPTQKLLVDVMGSLLELHACSMDADAADIRMLLEMLACCAGHVPTPCKAIIGTISLSSNVSATGGGMSTSVGGGVHTQPVPGLTVTPLPHALHSVPRCTAALAVINAVEKMVLQQGQPSGVYAEVASGLLSSCVGPARSTTGMLMGQHHQQQPANPLEVKVRNQAGQLLTLMLQMDATALAGVLHAACNNESADAPAIRACTLELYCRPPPAQPPSAPHMLPSGTAKHSTSGPMQLQYDDPQVIAVASACAVAWELRTDYVCCPAYWQAAGACAGQPLELAAAVLIAAGHTALLEPEQAVHPSLARTDVAGTAVRMGMGNVGSLLKALRHAAGEHLQAAAATGHLLGAHAAAARAAQQQLPAGLGRAALRAVIRLLCGTDASLAACTAVALAAHCRMDAWQDALAPLLLSSAEHRGVLLWELSDVVHDLMEGGSMEQGLQRSCLPQTLRCVGAVLRASSEEEVQHAAAYGLACRTWGCLLGLLKQGSAAAASPASLAALPIILDLLPTAWYYLLVPPSGRGAAPPPALLQAWLPAVLAWVTPLAYAAAGQGPKWQGDDAWMPAAGGSAAAGGGLEALVCSCEVMVPTLRDLGSLPQAVVQAARAILAPHGPPLPPPLLLRLAELLPEAAPGNLALGTQHAARAGPPALNTGSADSATIPSSSALAVRQGDLQGQRVGGLLTSLPSKEDGGIGGMAALGGGRRGGPAGGPHADVMDLTLSDAEEDADLEELGTPQWSLVQGVSQTSAETAEDMIAARRASHVQAGSSGAGIGGGGSSGGGVGGGGSGVAQRKGTAVSRVGSRGRGGVTNNPFATTAAPAGAMQGPWKAAPATAGMRPGTNTDQQLDDLPLSARMEAYQEERRDALPLADKLKQLRSALCDAARAARTPGAAPHFHAIGAAGGRSAGGAPSSAAPLPPPTHPAAATSASAGALSLPDSWRTLQKLEQLAGLRSSDAGAGNGVGDGRGKARGSVGPSRGEMWRQVLLGGGSSSSAAGGPAPAADTYGMGPPTTRAAPRPSSGPNTSGGWDVLSSGAGSSSYGNNTFSSGGSASSGGGYGVGSSRGRGQRRDEGRRESPPPLQPTLLSELRARQAALLAAEQLAQRQAAASGSAPRRSGNSRDPFPGPTPAAVVVDVADDDALFAELDKTTAGGGLSGSGGGARGGGAGRAAVRVGLLGMVPSASNGMRPRTAIQLGMGGGRRSGTGIDAKPSGLPQGPVLRMADVHADVIKLQLEELMPAGAHAPATGSSNSSLNAAAFGSGASGRGRSGVSLVRKGPAPPRVPLRFSSLQHYTHVFRSLLMEEMKAAIQNALEEAAASAGSSSGSSSALAELFSVLRTDDAFTVQLHVGGDAGRSLRLADAANTAAGAQGQGQEGAGQDNAYNNTGGGNGVVRCDDLVVLVRLPGQHCEAAAAGAAGGSHGGGLGPLAALVSGPHVLALITDVTREPSGVRRLTLQTRGAGSSTSSAMGGSTTAAAGSTSYGGGGGTAAAALLLPRTQWRVTTLYSLVPHFREFQALCNVHQLPEATLRFLLSPSTSNPSSTSSNPRAVSNSRVHASSGARDDKGITESPSSTGSGSTQATTQPTAQTRPTGQAWQCTAMPGGLRSALQAAYNSSQLDAIAACLEPGGQFTLVQGPPGTGKTSAIRGIVSVLLCQKAIKEFATTGSVGTDAASGNGRGGMQPAGLLAAPPQRSYKRPSAAMRNDATAAAAMPIKRAKLSNPPESSTLPASTPATVAATATGSASAATGRGITGKPPVAPSTGTAPAAAAQAPSTIQLGKVPPIRILVCAQSNGAIDELIARIASEGVWGVDGQRRAPGVVRVGRMEALHANAVAYHVDVLAEALESSHAGATQASANAQDAQKEVVRLRNELQELSARLREAEQVIAQAQAGAAGGGGGDAGAAAGRERSVSASRLASKDSDGLHRGKEGEGVRCISREQDRREDGKSDARKDQEDLRSRDGGGRDDGKADGGVKESSMRQGCRASSDGVMAATADERGDASRRERGDPEARTEQVKRTERNNKDKHDAYSGKNKRESELEKLSRDRSVTPTDVSADGDGLQDAALTGAAPSAGANPIAQAAGKAAASAASEALSSLRGDRGRAAARLAAAERAVRRGGKDVERARVAVRQAVVAAAEVVVATLSSAGGDLASLWPASAAAMTGRGAGPSAASLAPGASNTPAGTSTHTINHHGNRSMHNNKESSGGSNASSSSSSSSSTMPLFDALVVDEAAQALEPATLIPLQLLRPMAKVILVGDPQQLPPTVLSRAAEAAKLSQSLFERLHSAGCAVHMLATQYRMHPAISAFPSAYFYQSRLADGVSGELRAAACHLNPLLGPLTVLDCRDGRERSGGSHAGGSLVNRAEAELAAELYKELRDRWTRPHAGNRISSSQAPPPPLSQTSHPSQGQGAKHAGSSGTGGSSKDGPLSVALLSPYRAQLGALRSALRAVGVSGLELESIDIATVDGFQGREADVIIFTAVRARAPASTGPGSSNGSGVGFLADVRRMNVALTRARRCLWVVGHVPTLASCPPWRAFLLHAAAQQAVFSVAAPFRHALRDYGGGDRRSKVAPIRTQDIEQMLEQRGNGNDTPMAHVAEAGVAKPANARPTAVAKRSRSPYSTA